MSNVVLVLIGGLGSMFGYGTSDFFAKTVINKIGNVLSLIYVQLLGALMLLIYLIYDHSLPELSLKKLLIFMTLGLFYSLGYLLLYRAFEVGKMSIVSPIASVYSVLAAIVSFVFFAEVFNLNKAFILVLIFSGVIFTSVNFADLKGDFKGSVFSKGVIEALISALIFGLFFPLWNELIQGDGWVLWLIFLRLYLVLVVGIYFFFQKRDFSAYKIESHLWPRLLLVSFLEVFAFFIMSYALNKAEDVTSVVVAIQSAYSIVTAILAFIFLKERLALNQYIGVGLIIVGLVLFPLIT